MSNTFKSRGILQKLRFLWVALVLPLICITVSAVGNPVIEISNKSESVLTSVFNEVNATSKDLADFSFMTTSKVSESNNLLVTLNMQGYRSLDREEKQTLMGVSLNALQKSKLPNQTKVKLYNFVEGQDEATASLVRQLSQDVSADFATAYAWFRPFTGSISTLLGVISLGLFISLALMTLLDLSYLSVSIIDAFLTPADGSKPKLISKEAFNAKTRAEEKGSNKDAVGLYLKSKSMRLVLISITLLYLVGGKLYDLIAWIIDAFSGFVV